MEAATIAAAAGAFNLAAAAPLRVELGLGGRIETPWTPSHAPPAEAPDARGALAVYCRETCGTLDLASFEPRNRLPKEARSRVMVASSWGPEYGVPDAAVLADWGVGDTAEAPAAKQVLVVTWAAPRAEAAEALSEVGRAAMAAGEWVEDVDTGRVYGRAAFGEALQAGGLTLATVQDSGEGRLVTRGLRKLGLPELVAEGPVGEEDAGAAGLRAVARKLYELERVTPAVEADDGCGGTFTARLAYAARKKEDPAAPLATVAWNRKVRLCEEEAAISNEAPPAEVHAAPPPEVPAGEPAVANLDQARVRALTRLRGPVRDAFRAGLPAGDRLMVKAPFEAEDGAIEWLWLVVDEWTDEDVISGRMSNQPSLVEGLSKGDAVGTELALVFDYLWIRADGSREGNTTAAFVR